MITPIRGRKRYQLISSLCFRRRIRNDNPDKGTETPLFVSRYICGILIRNDNPDKGTETLLVGKEHRKGVRLEMITPIRGRKLSLVSFSISSFILD